MKFIKKIAIGLLIISMTIGSLSAQDLDRIKFPKLNPLNIPEIEKITLDNGIRLYLLQDKSLPVFHASARINCGSYLEQEEMIGLASICGSVMRTGGTSKWTGDEIDEMLEGVGASVETSIGLASGRGSINILSKYTDLGLEILAQVMRYPVFDEDKIELAKVQARSGISRRNDNPQQITFREYRKLIYGTNSVFARHSEYKTINAITRQDLIDFHGKYLKPQNIQLAVWGDFERDDLLIKINSYFGDWKKEGEAVPPLPTVDYNFESHVFYINRPDVNQTNIVMGHIGGLLTDADYPARIVMNNILGGGFSSRLFSTVRSKEGLAYAVFGVYTANISYPGLFYCFASTKSETTVKTIREIIKQINRIQTDPPTGDEMASGQDGYLNSFVFNFDSKSEVVNRLMNYDFHGLPDDYLFREKEGVEKVSAEDVINAAKNNLRPDAMKILVVGKGDDFEIPLDQAGLGQVATIDITIPSGEEKSELTVNEETIKKGHDLLAKAVEAAGGLENFKKIESVMMTGTLTVTTPQGEFAASIESIEAYPDKRKTVINVMGSIIYDIRNGSAGWQTDQMTGEIIPKTEDDLMEDEKEQSRNTILLFQQSDNPLYKAVYNGSGSEAGTSVEYVALLDEEGETICTMGLNSKTYELVSKSYWGRSVGGEGSIVETFSDFSEVKGIKVPMKIDRKMNGQKVSSMEISSFDINAELPANTFDKP